MNRDVVVESVLRAFLDDRAIERLVPLHSAGGFSGARFWRVDVGRRRWCLRRWPRAWDRQRLTYIHDVLFRVRAAGFDLVPVPLRAGGGESVVRHGGFHWELAPWMPGQADFERKPTAVRLRAAMGALAEFHRAAAVPAARSEPCPAARLRLEFLGQLCGGERSVIGERLNSIRLPALRDRGPRILALFDLLVPVVSHPLRDASRIRVPLQDCIRDVRADHVLFEEDRVSGIVDFGSMKPDAVAADVARLLGSLAGDDPRRWRIGLEAYDRVSPLDDKQRRLVTALDQANVLLSGMNWLKWLVLEERRFDDPESVKRRLDGILSRMAHLAHGVA